VSGGYVGVDIFFVISGFLITSILLGDLNQKSFSIINFYERRVRRILPALYVMVLSCLVVGYIVMLPQPFIELARTSHAAVLFISNHAFWGVGGYFEPNAKSMPLLHTWSLAIEEQYYVGFPLLLYILRNQKKLLILLAIAGIAVVSYSLMMWGMTHHPGAAFYLAPPRAWELMAGAMLALMISDMKLSEKWAHTTGLLGLALILFSVVSFTEDIEFPGPYALLPTLGACLVIVAGTSEQALSSRILSCQPLRAMGAISYSLYLWHWPIMVFGVALLPYQMDVGTKAGLIVFSVGVSYLSWRFIETPFRRPARQFLRSSVFVLAICFGGLLIGVSDIVEGQHGFPERFAFSVPDAQYEKKYRIGTCLLETQKDVANFQIQNCKAGHPGQEPDSIIWGDSHAAHYTIGLSSIGEQHAFSFYQVSLGGCPPLVGEDRGEKECRDFNDNVLSLVKDQPHIENVIVAANWEVYAKNLDLLPSLKKTLSTLNEMGKTIVLIGPGPNFEIDVPSLYQLSLSRYGKWRGDKFHALKDEALEPVFRQLDELPSVSIVLPYEVFCNGKDCRVYENGEFLFWDTNHLTSHGSKQVAEKIYQALFN